jgi:hypothetical protein
MSVLRRSSSLILSEQSLVAGVGEACPIHHANDVRLPGRRAIGTEVDALTLVLGINPVGTGHELHTALGIAQIIAIVIRQKMTEHHDIRRTVIIQVVARCAGYRRVGIIRLVQRNRANRRVVELRGARDHDNIDGEIYHRRIGLHPAQTQWIRTEKWHHENLRCTGFDNGKHEAPSPKAPCFSFNEPYLEYHHGSILAG